MNTNTALTTVRPPATVAMILGKPESPRPAILKHAVTTAGADHSAKFREDIRRRYETPFKTPWHHGA